MEEELGTTSQSTTITHCTLFPFEKEGMVDMPI
jgi:hypothetical protein